MISVSLSDCSGDDGHEQSPISAARAVLPVRSLISWGEMVRARRPHVDPVPLWLEDRRRLYEFLCEIVYYRDRRAWRMGERDRNKLVSWHRALRAHSNQLTRRDLLLEHRRRQHADAKAGFRHGDHRR